MIHVYLYMDEDGDLWSYDGPDGNVVGNMSDYDWETEEQLTEDQIIATAIAESTEQTEGSWSLIDMEREQTVRTGAFVQGSGGYSGVQLT